MRFGPGGLWDALGGGVAPGAFASGVAGAELYPDFYAGGQAGEVEAAFFARVGKLPHGAGCVGVAGGEADFVVVHDAGLAGALAGEFAFFVAGCEFEAGGFVGDGARGGRAFYAELRGFHFGHGGGEFADVAAEVVQCGDEGALGGVLRIGGGAEGCFGGGDTALRGFERGDFCFHHGEFRREAGEDGLPGGAVFDVGGPDDEVGDGEVGEVEYYVKHRIGLFVEDLLEGAWIVVANPRVVVSQSRLIIVRHGVVLLTTGENPANRFFGGKEKISFS